MLGIVLCYKKYVRQMQVCMSISAYEDEEVEAIRDGIEQLLQEKGRERVLLK